MRTLAVAERLTALAPEAACHTIERLLATALARPAAEAQDVLLALGLWLGRSRSPARIDDWRLIAAQADPAVERLLSGATVGATPLAVAWFEALLPEASPRRRTRWADGVGVAELAAFFTRADVVTHLTSRGHSHLSPGLFAAHMQSRLCFRGSGALRQIAELLDAPRLSPRVVVQIAASAPLPYEICDGLLVRDRWISRVDVREALVQNRSAPAEMVAALLPCATNAAIRRVLQAGRHEAAVQRWAKLVRAARSQAETPDRPGASAVPST